MKKFVIVVCIMLSLSIFFCFSASAVSDFYFTKDYWYVVYTNAYIMAKSYVSSSDVQWDGTVNPAIITEETFVIGSPTEPEGSQKDFYGTKFSPQYGYTGYYVWRLPLHLTSTRFTQSFVFINFNGNDTGADITNLNYPWNQVWYRVEYRGYLASGGVTQTISLIRNVDYTISTPFYLYSGYLTDTGVVVGNFLSAVIVSVDFELPEDQSGISDMSFYIIGNGAENAAATYVNGFNGIYSGVFLDPATQIGVADQTIIAGIENIGKDISGLGDNISGDLSDLGDKITGELDEVQDAIGDLNDSLVTPDPENEVAKGEQKEEFDKVSDELGQIGEALGGVDKPDPSTIVPGISDITSDIEIYNGDVISMLFLPIYDSKFIHWIFASVCSFALVGYILFGKRV